MYSQLVKADHFLCGALALGQGHGRPARETFNCLYCGALNESFDCYFANEHVGQVLLSTSWTGSPIIYSYI